MAKHFVNSLHAFRGFAIVNIVAIHAIEFIFFFANSTPSTPKPNLIPYAWSESILFHDSTLYFTLISGILFSMVLAERGYSSFFKSKLRYVVLPYVFFTCIVTYRNWGFDGSLTLFDGSLLEYLSLVANNLLTGAAIFSFWYIPVLLVLYIATPALAKLIALEKTKWLVILIILAPLVCSRAWPDVTWTNYVYFLGAYTLGIVVGKSYTKTIEIIARYFQWFILVVIGTTATLYGLFYLESPTWGIVIFTESAWYIQKIALAGLVLLFFERALNTISKTIPKFLDILGNYAFAIYFLHAYLLFEMYNVMNKIMVAPNSVPIILTLAFLNLVTVILLSILITYACKLILGKWSRYILGA